MQMTVGYDIVHGGNSFTSDVGELTHNEAVEIAQQLVDPRSLGSVVVFPEYDYVRIVEDGVEKEFRKNMVDFRSKV